MSEELRATEEFSESDDGTKTLGFNIPAKAGATTVEIVYQWKEFGEYGIWVARISPDYPLQRRREDLMMIQHGGMGRSTFMPIPFFDAAIERRFGLNNIITRMYIGKDEGGNDQSDFWLELLQNDNLQGQFFVHVYDNR